MSTRVLLWWIGFWTVVVLGLMVGQLLQIGHL